VSTGGGCSLQPNLAADTFYNDYLPGLSCKTADITISFSASVRADAQLGALSTVSISNARFDGVQLTEAGASRITGAPYNAAAQFERIERLLRAAP
jgi:hypothetical protein